MVVLTEGVTTLDAEEAKLKVHRDNSALNVNRTLIVNLDLTVNSALTVNKVLTNDNRRPVIFVAWLILFIILIRYPDSLITLVRLKDG